VNPGSNVVTGSRKAFDAVGGLAGVLAPSHGARQFRRAEPCPKDARMRN